MRRRTLFDILGIVSVLEGLLLAAVSHTVGSIAIGTGFALVGLLILILFG